MTPTVDWFGLTILEPTTMITDFAITATGWWAAWRLLTSDEHRRYRCRRLWGAGLFFVGLGALLGGVMHGFAAYLGDTGNLIVWKSTVYAIGLSLVFVVAGTISGTPMKAATAKSLRLLNLIVFVLYAAWMIRHDDFLYVIYYYGPTMLVVAAIHGWAHVRHRSNGAIGIVSGVVVTLLGAAVQQSGISIHAHFNHNDLFHIIQILGLVLFFKGVSALRAEAPQGYAVHRA